MIAGAGPEVWVCLKSANDGSIPHISHVMHQPEWAAPVHNGSQGSKYPHVLWRPFLLFLMASASGAFYKSKWVGQICVSKYKDPLKSSQKGSKTPQNFLFELLEVTHCAVDIILITLASSHWTVSNCPNCRCDARFVFVDENIRARCTPSISSFVLHTIVCSSHAKTHRHYFLFIY